MGALAVGSGRAAETLAILNLASFGDYIVSSASLYGGTYNLFRYMLPKLGVASPSLTIRTTSTPGEQPSGRAPRRSSASRSATP